MKKPLYFFGILIFVFFIGNLGVSTIYYNWYDPTMGELRKKFEKEGSGIGGTMEECVDIDGRGCDGVAYIVKGASNLVARDNYCKKENIVRLNGWYDRDPWPFNRSKNTFSFYFKKWW